LILYDSIFKSIQGEGQFSGKSSLFLRFAGCNLNCIFCDTKQSSDKAYSYKWKKEPSKTIVKKILNHKPLPPNLVITGGEPLLQVKSINYILAKIKNNFRTIEIETNGTLSGKRLFEFNPYFNVSIKLSNSKTIREKRIKPDIINEFLSYRKSFFKFVIKNKKDLNEVIKIKNTFDIKSEIIYLMPLADSKDKLKKIEKKVFLYSLENGFNYSDRLQIRFNIK